MTETQLLSRLLIRASELGLRLFRNQVGRYRLALPDCKRCQQQGRVLSSGLCVGSSDHIGWTPYVVQASDVGRTLAVFTAVEAKVGRNTTTEAQGHFLAVVRDAGGIALVARQEEDIVHATQRLTISCDCPAHR